ALARVASLVGGMFFFFQAEDGIRDFHVTGVQTCALPILAQEIVLLIGGPGSGKTTLLNHLASLGYTCYPEISRQVTLEAQKQGIDQLFLKDPLLFSQKLLEGRIQQHINAQKDPSEVVIIDRGIPDVLAYMDFIKDTYPDSFTEACQTHRYTKVFALP